jgi:hypothetical protein
MMFAEGFIWPQNVETLMLKRWPRRAGRVQAVSRKAGVMRFAIFTVAWCGAVFWFWQNCVPVLPDSVIRPRDANWHVGYTRAGEIVFCGRAESDEGVLSMAGPLHFWEPSTGRLDREFLDDRDRILGLSLGDQGVAMIRRDDRLRMIDLRTGQVLLERPAAEQLEQVSFSLDEKLVSIAVGGTFTICDVREGRERWSKPEATFDRFDDAGRVTARGHRSNGASGRPALMFDAWTGEPTTPDPASVSAKQTQLSSRGGYSIVSFGADDLRVCDKQTGKSLWSLPHGIPPYQFRFSFDGSHVVIPYRTTLGVRFARWKAVSGDVVEPLPPGAEAHSRAFASHDERFAVVSEERGVGGFPAGMVRFVNGFGLGWSGRIGAEGESVLVRDYHSDRRYRVAGENVQPLMSPDGTGFAMSTADGLEYYEFPPRRNWWWLAGWCLLPPLTFRFLHGRWRAVKQHLRASMPTFFPSRRRAAME